MPSSELRGQIEAVATNATVPKVPATESRCMTPVLYILEVEGDGAQCLNVVCVLKVNERITISSAEILQCHTFTKCLLCTVVPPGFTIGDLCTPRESYQGHSHFSLGESVEMSRQGGSSQAYTGASAIEPNPTREQSIVSQNDSGIERSTSEQNLQADKSANEQLTPTLSWTAKPIDQQPIAPSKKKERPSVRPSSKQGPSANQALKTPVAKDQDVEMTDAACNEGSKKASGPAAHAASGDDPIESYGSCKTNNEDMEVDLEGPQLSDPKSKEVKGDRSRGGDKPSKEVIAAIASPQKPRQNIGRPDSPKEAQVPSTIKNRNAGRPPGITIFQHSALLAKDREKRDQAALSGLDPHPGPKTGKRQAKAGHRTTLSRKATNPNISSLLQKAVNTPIQSQPHEIDELEKNVQEDTIIDIEREDLNKILAEENVIKQSIHEANIKCHSEDEQEFRTLTGKYAVDFLKTMNGTLCYLMVAFRMLAKALWTARMVCVHVRQAALYAISKGWFFHTHTV